MNLIDKIQKKHAEVLDFYSSEKLTERERNLLRTEMAFLLELKSDAEALNIDLVSNRLLAEKTILALDDYGRKTHSVEYGLPIDPDTKDFEDKRPQEMLKIVTDILNGC